MPRAFFKCLTRDKRGVTVTEFALAAPPLLMLITGTFDLGWQVYASSVLQGAMQEVARKATLENASLDTVNTTLDTRMKAFATADKVNMTARSFETFGGVGKPEKITTDIAPIGTYNVGDCYIDSNASGTYDVAQGSTGIGGADDVVEYTVTVEYKRLTPVASLIGMSNPVILSRSTMLRNEPYAGVVDPPTRCS